MPFLQDRATGKGSTLVFRSQAEKEEGNVHLGEVFLLPKDDRWSTFFFFFDRLGTFSTFNVHRKVAPDYCDISFSCILSTGVGGIEIFKFVTNEYLKGCSKIDFYACAKFEFKSKSVLRALLVVASRSQGIRGHIWAINN